MHHFGRMCHAPVRHIADMQQAVDAAEVHESAIFSEVFHHTRHHCALGQMFEGGLFARARRFFHGHLAGYHNVAAPPVQLEDLYGNVLADELIQIVNRPDIHLRAGHEGRHANVDHQPAFGAFGNVARDQQLLVHGLLERVPNTQAAGARMGQQHIAFRPRPVMVHHHVNRIARFKGDGAIRLFHLLDRNQAFELISEIDDDFLGGDLDHMAQQQLALRWGS